MRIVWLCFALWAGGPGVSAAAQSRIDTGEVVVHSGGGHLPVGPTVTRDQAIAAAYSLPAVQAAITFMVSRGYVAHPMYDEAGLAPEVPARPFGSHCNSPGSGVFRAAARSEERTVLRPASEPSRELSSDRRPATNAWRRC